MKFLHTSDLHIGKKLQGYSLAEDQRYILHEIAEIARSENVDGILVAGDVYDSATPTEESFRIFDGFLTEASEVCPVYVIAGNHDSEGRLGVGNKVMARAGVHITDPYQGVAEKVVLRDGYGELDLFLMPYISRTAAAEFYRGKENIPTIDAAIKTTLAHSGVDPGKRDVLVAHQHFAAVGVELEQVDSETDRLNIGNTKTVSTDLLKDFDYCALGHIHKPQGTGAANAVYCGTPLKYDYSERNDRKHVNIVEIKGKGDVTIKEVQLRPLREMVCIRGTYMEAYAQLNSVPKDSLVYVTLTERGEKDRERIAAKTASVGSTLVEADYDLVQTGEIDYETPDIRQLSVRSDIDMFREFYRKRTGKELSPEQDRIMEDLFRTASEGGEL